MSHPLSPLAEAVSSRRRLYRARERPMPSLLLLVKAAVTPLSLVCFTYIEHGIPCDAYSFREKLTTSDLNSPLRLSCTRPFPPPSRLFLKSSRNNPSRLSFRLSNPQSPIFNHQSPSPILNHQSPILDPQSVPRRPSSVAPHPPRRPFVPRKISNK